MLLVGTYYNSLTWCTGGGHGEAGAVCENNLFEAIDFNVIGLLLGMMIFAGMLEISGFFEFALVKRDSKNLLILYPSGVPVIERDNSALRTDHNIPKISREQMGKIWQSRKDERRKIKLVPANE